MSERPLAYPMICLPYPPSNNVYYRHSGKFTYLSAKGKEFKERAGWIAKQAGVKCLEGDVSIIFILHPKLNKDGTANKSRIDLDNSFKSVFDSLLGIAYFDDKQIVRIVAEIGSAIKGGGVTLQIKDVASYESLS